eukprot:4511246-Alexandrium_andersonii.AAC.1
MRLPKDTGIVSVFARTYCLPRGRGTVATADGGGTPSPDKQTVPADGGGQIVCPTGSAGSSER